MKLTVNGKTILIDSEDYERIKDYSMWVHNTKKYVFLDKIVNGKRTRHRLHRYIMGAKDSKIFIDHINGEKLDNRKSNLRFCNNSQNLANRGKTKLNTSGYKGVSKTYSTSPKQWRARIQHKHIGRFYTKEEAALAYNKAAIKIYGEYAKLNEVKK
jgi:hypothetical protein